MEPRPRRGDAALAVMTITRLGLEVSWGSWAVSVVADPQNSCLNKPAQRGGLPVKTPVLGGLGRRRFIPDDLRDPVPRTHPCCFETEQPRTCRWARSANVSLTSFLISPQGPSLQQDPRDPAWSIPEAEKPEHTVSPRVHSVTGRTGPHPWLRTRLATGLPWRHSRRDRVPRRPQSGLTCEAREMVW